MFTIRKQSCGKVTFSEACVKNSVHGGHVWKGRHAWQGWCAWQGAMRGGGHGVTGDTATAADGTHPTGMHSY